MDSTALLATIGDSFPESGLAPISEARLLAITGQYPDVPQSYVDFPRQVGAGRIGHMGFMLYDGLMEPSEFFDPATAEPLNGILFFGDDFCGWMVGFDTEFDWAIVGVDSANPVRELQSAKNIGDFIGGWVTERSGS